MQIEFEWHLSGPDPVGDWEVIERLVGTEFRNVYTLPSKSLAEATIKARRAFVNRTITSRTQAIQVFQPRGTIIQ